MKSAQDQKSNSSVVPDPSSFPVSPWLFVPILYIMQAMPVTVAQEMFPVTFKDLHVPNPLIVAWTSIIALPWTLKLFWAPLVDLNSTKRRWTLVMECLIGLSFVAVALSVLLPQYVNGQEQTGFAVVLGLLLIMASFSSTHDTACDGLYILALDRKRQAEFVGVQSSTYKLGRLLCVGGLVFLAGEFEMHGRSAARSWMIVLLIAAGLYMLGTIYNFFMLPRPVSDRPAVESQPGENRHDILRTLLVILLGVAIFLLVDSGIHLVGGGIFCLLNRNRAGSPLILPDWQQSIADMRYWATMQQIGFGLFVIACLLIRRNLRGTVMATAFVSFAVQSRFWAILLFIMFYRFGEAMVTRVLPLFLKDPLSRGGLNVSTRDVGLIIGTAGVLGIIFGGILGGLVVARIGLRRSFWPLAISMHVPNLFYLLIAMANRRVAEWMLYPAAFVHEFAYGFGFAAYSLFLMMIAQRREFKTTHYAFGTGLGALCGVAAGIVSAILLASVSYIWFFVAVCVLTIPGMLTLLVIPME